MLALRCAALPTSLAGFRFFSTYASPSYAARPLPLNSPADAGRRGTGVADSEEQLFEAKLDAEPDEAPVKRLSLYDTLWADVEADNVRRRSKEERAKLHKEVKEPVKRKPKCVLHSPASPSRADRRKPELQTDEGNEARS